MAGTGFPPDTRLTRRVAETWLLVLLMAFGYGALLGLLAQWAFGWPWWLGLLAAVVAGAVMYVVEDGSVLPRSLPIADVDPAGERDRRLVAAVDRLCALAALDPPRLKIVDVEWPNALAVRLPGRRPTVAVTRGLLERCDDERLDAVLAHELAHIAHRDAAVMTVATAMSASLALAPILVLLPVMALEPLICRAARWCGRPWTPATEDDSFELPPVRSHPENTALLLLFTVVPLLALVRTVVFLLILGLGLGLLPPLLVLALPVAGIIARMGRYRELAADRAAAELTGQPAALAAALTDLDAEGPRVPTKDLRQLTALSAMSIVALPKDEKDTGTDAFSRLLDRMMASHPPLPARLDRLAALSRDLGRDLGR